MTDRQTHMYTDGQTCTPTDTHVHTHSVLSRIFSVVVGLYNDMYPVYNVYCLSSLYMYYLRGGYYKPVPKSVGRTLYTDRQTDRQTDIHRDIGTHTCTQTDRESHIPTYLFNSSTCV